jgi:dihydroxy-acid dehydratase
VRRFSVLHLEALGKFNNTIVLKTQRSDPKCLSCAGACGGMYTANTMSSSIEALGMSLPYSSSNPALSEEENNKNVLMLKSNQNLVRERYKA